MKKIIRSQRWFFITSCIALLSVGLSACSSTENDKTSPSTPDVPISNDDWQTVPANGGTIDKGDIALTFPSGTFGSDANIAITEVQKGQTGGNNEASKFYQISMPCTTNKPITVKIKSNEEGDNISFVAFADSYCMSNGEDRKAELQYETTYSNGEYSATIPTINGGVADENVNFIIGLGRFNNPRKAGTRGLLTEVLYEGKVGNISYQLRYPWSLFSHNTDVLNRLAPISLKINDYIKESITQITSLGFKVEGEKILYVDFDLNETDWGGHQVCGIPGGSGYSMWVSLGVKKVLESTEDQIKCTVIHEIFHWFQSYYDPRSNLAKSKKSLSGEETILYEAGAVWAEQFMNSGKLNGEFVKDYLPLYTISVKDLDAVFSFEKDASVTKSSQEKYKRHGYALSTLLYYLTSPIADMKAFNIDKTKIVEIYKKWTTVPGSGFWPIESWLYDHNSGFLHSTQFDEYVIALMTGKLIEEVNINNVGYPEGLERKAVINELGKKEFKATCYNNGTASHKFDFTNYINNEKTFKGKKIVVKQNGGEDISTYIIAQNKSNFKLLKGSFSENDSLTIGGDELDNLFGKGERIMLHVLTINHNHDNSEFGVSLELKEETNKDFKIEDIDLEFDYTTNRDGRQSGGFFKIGFIKERIKVTRKDNTYTVVCENKDSYTTEFLSFDVTMQDNKFGPITNLTAGRTSNDGKDKFSFDATDIELSSSNSELATWKGYDKNGMKVSNLSGHNEYWTDNGYIADPKNLLRIDITLDDEYE